MKQTTIIFIFVGVAACAVIFFYDVTTTKKEQALITQSNKSNSVVTNFVKISDEEAVGIAKKGIEGKAEYDTTKTIRVERTNNVIRVVFPITKPVRARGSDFAAQVTIDESTGEIVDILGAN